MRRKTLALKENRKSCWNPHNLEEDVPPTALVKWRQHSGVGCMPKGRKHLEILVKLNSLGSRYLHSSVDLHKEGWEMGEHNRCLSAVVLR